MAFEDWKEKSESFEHDRLWEDEVEEHERAHKVRKVRSDLIDFGLEQGYNDNQIKSAIDALALVMAPALHLYIFVGHPYLAVLIEDDVTLPWLNLTFGGSTLRQKLINRLS